MTTSIGLASWPDDGISHSDIIAAADVTLYRAKRNGGNQSLCASGPLAVISDEEVSSKDDDNISHKLSGLVRSFSEVIDARSCYAHNHSKKVKDYALTLANALNLNKEQTAKLEICTLLHDAGKIGISREILSKSGDLTEEEWRIIKTHPLLGANIVRQLPQFSGCAEAILHHHEWYDGTGYPDGLAGDAIPLESRIISIVEAFVTMTAERSYSGTKTMESAAEELGKRAGTQFDPELVERFISIFEKPRETSPKKARR